MRDRRSEPGNYIVAAFYESDCFFDGDQLVFVVIHFFSPDEFILNCINMHFLRTEYMSYIIKFLIERTFHIQCFYYVHVYYFVILYPHYPVGLSFFEKLNRSHSEPSPEYPVYMVRRTASLDMSEYGCPHWHPGKMSDYYF